MGISSVEAFYRGIKPSFFATSRERKFMREVYPSIIREYPYIDQGVQLVENADCYLFFQHEKDKRDFVKKTNGLTPNDPEFHRALGLTLGYPPDAVEYYVYKMKLPDEEQDKLRNQSIAIYYCGQSIMTPIDGMIKNVAWLWDKYHFSESLRIGYIKEGLWATMEVSYEQYDELRRVRNRIKAFRNLGVS